MLACGQCGERTASGAKFCPECGTALHREAAPKHHSRKTVTIVFSDLVGSTSLGEQLDVESLREVMDDYFRVMRTVLEGHGGVVEKFIGDAVMAVFGLPHMHEDDALQAVRAAVAMRDALAVLNEGLSHTRGVTLSMRTGVNTGVVVVGDAAGGQRLAIGDAVNVAARLEQAAPPEGVVLGPDTFRLVRSYVEADLIGPLTLKGKSEGIDAWLLAFLQQDSGDSTSTRSRSLVGRLSELTAIEVSFDAATRGGRVESVLVVGGPGLGKSRLVAAATEHLSRAPLVLRATCRPYGTTAFRPIADLLSSALETGETLNDTMIGTLAADAPAAERQAIIERVASFLGLSADSFPPEQYAWATAGLLASTASRRSLLLVIEDLHWAETALLDLLGQLKLYPHGPGTLILGTARPELLDMRPLDDPLAEWKVVTLQPLSTAESNELVDRLLDSPSLSRDALELIHGAAQGNPLFVEQALATWMEEGVLSLSAGGWTVTRRLTDVQVPASIRAIFAARVDRLTDNERLVLSAAAVAGASCDARVLRFLLGRLDPTALNLCIDQLIRRGLLQRGSADHEDDAELWFEHASLREVTTEMTLKSDRAALHERFAMWMEKNRGAARGDESIGHHLAAAYKYRSELRHKDPDTLTLALRSARHLADDCQQALRIGDRSSAEGLTGQVVALLTDCGTEVCATDLALMEKTAKLLVTMGRWNESVELLAPYAPFGHGPLLRDLGVALCQLHRSEADSAQYLEGQRLLEIAGAAPNRDTDAVASLAGTWKGVDDARAQACYRRCLELDQSDPYALGNVLEHEIAAAGDLAVIDAMREQIIQASRRCRSQADAGVNLPWAYFDAGKFALLLGHPYDAIASYAKAVQLTTADHMLATSLSSLQRLSASGVAITGSGWAQGLLTLARAVWFPSKQSLDGVADAMSLPEIDEQTEVVFLAGGTDATVVGWFEHHHSTLLRGFTDFKGVVVSGGTQTGVAGLAGSLSERFGERITAVGYLPADIPTGLSVDPRYDRLRRTAEGDFSIGDSLQAWADLVVSRANPATMKLLALNGGQIAAAEYRVALALGCTVGAVAGSGGEADRLLDDRDWIAVPRLIRLGLESDAIRRFLATGAELGSTAGILEGEVHSPGYSGQVL